MKNIKLILTTTLFLLSCAGKMPAQDNKLFTEYISCFTEIQLTDRYQEYDTIGIRHPQSIKSEHLLFLNKEMMDTAAISPWLVFKVDTYYLAILIYEVTDFTICRSTYYYYAIFYDQNGNIVNNYKLLEILPSNSNEDYIVKFFFRRNSIKQQFYGYYDIKKEYTSCKEQLYIINNNGSLTKDSEQNYNVKSIDLITVW